MVEPAVPVLLTACNATPRTASPATWATMSQRHWSARPAQRTAQSAQRGRFAKAAMWATTSTRTPAPHARQ